MVSIFKHAIFIVSLVFFLIAPIGCCKSIEAHVMSNDRWLQEQVEKGHFTQEQADKYKKEIKVIHNNR